MKAAAIISALFAVLLEGIAAAEAGGLGGARDTPWLIPAGIACLALAFVFTLLT